MFLIRRSPRWRETRNESGFTLLEVTVGIAFLTIAFAGFTTILVSNERSHELAAQESLVTNRMRVLAEIIRSVSFSDIEATFQGFTFGIPEIGATGSCVIFVDETDTSPDAQALGLPRDLDGNGSATSTDVSDTYILLPVMLEVTWTNAEGVQERKFFFLLSLER